jgi:septal ring factor EnvC (AmiA/AmiB activator)
MDKLVRRIKLYVVLSAFLFSLGVMSCSSSPEEEEMRQLNDLKAEVASLEQQIAAREKEKSDLEKQVAEKNGRLRQCKTDKDAVAKGMVK